MGKALPCKRCQTDNQLRFRRLSENGLWWIACEGCGETSPAGSNLIEAGEKWNKQQENSTDA